MSVKTLFLENVKKYIRPQTDPVAIKLVFDGAEPVYIRFMDIESVLRS